MNMKVRGFIRQRAVSAMTQRSKAALYVDMAKGLFPRPIRIGARAVAWDIDEVHEWMQSRAEARDASQPVGK